MTALRADFVGDRPDTQVENCAALSIQENDSAEIPVSGDEQAVLCAGDFKQFLVRGPGKTDLRYANDIVS